MGDWEAPYLTYADVRGKAEAFLNEFHPSSSVPVPIDLIAERDFGLSIIPCPGLKDAFDVDGYVARNKRALYVDSNAIEKYYFRFRFTVAHELAHLVLHAGLFDCADYNTAEEWKTFIRNLDPNAYGWAHRQAHWFAGNVLLPPRVFNLRFHEMVHKATAGGFAIKEHFEEFMEFISKPLSREFEVSADVVERQIRKENLHP
jgi:Zn-dependent peptidase ImmA (M78 family)